MKIMNIAKEMVQQSVQSPSKRFGSWLLEVDHELLGEKARAFRLKHNVKAVQVGEVLGLDRVRICCLETGRKAWSAEELKDYLRAVRAVAKGQ